jgi:hypothetical protein
MVDRVNSTRYYDTNEIVELMREKVKNKYLDDEITEQEYIERMSELTSEQQAAEDVEGMKAKKFEELQDQFENDEISEEELEAEMDRLFDSGDEFLDVETGESTIESANSTIRDKLSYYALPLCILLPIIAVILVPGINPMMAVVAAPALLALGGLLYASLWVHRKT